jgi:hypothetical protein
MRPSRLVGLYGTRKLYNQNKKREEIPNMRSFLILQFMPSDNHDVRNGAMGGHETVASR